MVTLLYKFFEADDVGMATGTPLSPGVENRDFVIPNGERWCIKKFSGSSSKGTCEVELLYSDDAGDTWSNPFDSEASKLACIHLSDGSQSSLIFPAGFEFVGDSTNIILRMRAKNYNTDAVSEITCVLEGCCK